MLMAIVVGVFIAFVCVAGFDELSLAAYPPPQGMDFKNPAAIAKYMDAVPFGSHAIVAAGWFAAPFLGAATGILIGRRSLPGWIIASAFLVAATFNLIQIPHPQWMVLAGFILPGLAAMAAEFVLSGRVAS